MQMLKRQKKKRGIKGKIGRVGDSDQMKSVL